MAERHGIPSNPVFRGFNQSDCRYIIAYGGAGSGKSVNCAQLLAAKVSGIPGRNLMVIRKDIDSHRQSTRAAMVKAFQAVLGDSWADVWNVPSADLTLTNKHNGNVIIFRGVMNEQQREKLKSVDVPNGKITDVWIEEATALMPYDFDIIDDRLRGELPDGWRFHIYMTFNPVSASHWIKRRFFDVADDDVYICHSTYLDNRFIDDGFKSRMEKDRERNPEHFMVYGAGEWGEKGGKILTDFIVEDVPKDMSAYDAVSLGQDFGYNHANAVLLLGWKDGEVYVIAEHYKHDMTTADIITDIEKLPIFAAAKAKRLYMICDSAEPDRIAEWRRAGWRARPVDKGKGKATSSAIDWLKARRIHIDRAAENTAAEAGEWQWQRDKQTGSYTDEPVAINDDAMAALRYGSEPFRIASARRRKQVDNGRSGNQRTDQED